MRYTRETWIVIVTVIIIAAIIAVSLWSYAYGSAKPASGHSMDYRAEQLHKIKMCESNGNYRAVNVHPSEWHGKWRELGSFGAYQFSQAMWNETAQTMFEQTGRDWRNVRPDRAPKIIQDRAAVIAYNRYHHSRYGEELLWRNCSR